MAAKRRLQVLCQNLRIGMDDSLNACGRHACTQVTSMTAAAGDLPGQQLTTPGSDGYVFTHAADVLAAEQRELYERNGFLIVRNNIPSADLQIWRDYFLQLCAGAVPVPPGMQVVRDLGAIRLGGGPKATPATRATINKVQNLESDPVLNTYSKHPSIVRLLPAFTGISGAKVVPFTSMLVNKPPDAGLGTSRHPLHQDLWFMPMRPASKIVCAWTALERVNRKNGALFVVPGTHMAALQRHTKPDDGPVNAGFVGIEGHCNEAECERNDIVWVDLEPGDTLFFHPLLHHGSGRNTSEMTRQAISMHFVGTECVYFDPRQDAVQRERADRVARTGGHQYGDGGGDDIVALYKKRLRGTRSPNATVVFGEEGRHDNSV